jgi:hypothetical protein
MFNKFIKGISFFALLFYHGMVLLFYCYLLPRITRQNKKRTLEKERGIQIDRQTERVSIEKERDRERGEGLLSENFLNWKSCSFIHLKFKIFNIHKKVSLRCLPLQYISSNSTQKIILYSFARLFSSFYF